ncbi:MAG: helix-turn-helix transcriptional regulator [Lachnospiraceae bacterium]|nr:helix-turn-helix transcriptional regulator [Lachnospiraceae bacterium]
MITFDPLWETLKKRGISQYELIHKHHVSTGTLDSLRKNKSVTLNTINDLCRIIGCDIQDIVRFLPDK